MQCIHAFISPTTLPYPPRTIKISNSKSKLSAATRKTQIQKTPSGNLDDNGLDNSLGFKGPSPTHVKSITSTSNPFVKHCLKLRQSSSYRHSHGSVLVVGSTPIREICLFLDKLQGRNGNIDCLLVHEKSDVPQGLEDLSLSILRLSTLVMKKLSGVQSTESVEAIALMRIPTSFINLNDDQKEADCKGWFPTPHRILVLDGIQDPGNLGTLLRSAMAFKWGGIFLLPGCCDPFNDKALRASCGAVFQLPIVSGNWSHLQLLKSTYQMKLLAGHPEITKIPKPVSVLSQKFADSLAEKALCLVLGSEGRGLSDESWRLCELLSIPMAGEFESLNVSVAGGIFLYMLQSRLSTKTFLSVYDSRLLIKYAMPVPSANAYRSQRHCLIDI